MGNKGNRKPLARLKARIADWDSVGNKPFLEANGLKMNKPGSHNRKK